MKTSLNLFLLLLTLGIIQSCGTNCSEEAGYHPDCGCPGDKTVFSENCIETGNSTYYFGSFDFFCINDSVAIGVDTIDKKIKAFAIEDNLITSYGGGSYNVDLFQVMGVECEVDRVAFVTVNDKTELDLLPSELKIDLYLKESTDFNSNTIESKQVIISRR